ncbi:MAG: COX15/CtaA family protein [Planctomycetota bacterium]
MSVAAGNPEVQRAAASAWPNRFAWLLCGMTFPLLCVGQLITTTDAGMAVPDWPGTYGYNMFLYPAETWLFGPWDLFIEHGHRLLASVVGMVTIALVAVVWWCDRRWWMRTLAVAALLLVILQGVLGGMRVLANERLIAMAHGSTGPLFFALTCGLVVLTARQATTDRPSAGGRVDLPLARLATVTAVLAYLQLILGASLRHIDASVGPWSFATLVKFHLGMAGVVAAHALWLAWRSLRSTPALRRLGGLVGVAVVGQVTLGFATWLAKYGSPRWASDLLPATIQPITAAGWNQTNTVTGHSALGSLLLGLLTAAAVAAWRARQAAAGSHAAVVCVATPPTGVPAS